MKENINFNAHHSPVGAFSSFTLGYKGPHGGFGCELGKPADQHIYIGCESREQKGSFKVLPFYGETGDAEDDFVVEDQGDVVNKAPVDVFPDDSIERFYNPCRDQWKCEDFEFTLFTPTPQVPDPKSATDLELKQVLIPAVFAEIRLDNSKGNYDRRVFFGFQPSNLDSHIREFWKLADEGIAALGVGDRYAVATHYEGANTSIHFSLDTLLGENDRDRYHFGNGTTGILDWVVPAGEDITIPLTLAFHRNGIVTSGLECSYYYQRYFSTLESVVKYGLQEFASYRDAALRDDAKWDRPDLNAAQRFQLAHSIRSYYGSTQLLDHDGEPFWIVNEGEYRMINTLDLAVDQVFFEMRQNPWTTANVLENYLRYYSYRDRVFQFENPQKTFPGGLSFCHDMGVCNCFTRLGNSCYEIGGLKGCFSYMTHEELVNWLNCALVYANQVDDGKDWLIAHESVLLELLDSLLNRDSVEDENRNGIMGLDSKRTVDGEEITTYDSLDPSLGKSRGNCYLAVKTWAVYLGLEKVFEQLGRPEQSRLCRDQAKNILETIEKAVTQEGTVPASIEDDCGYDIIPVVEGLAYANFNGRSDVFEKNNPNYGLIEVLKQHLEKVLVNGRCLFEDNGWRLTTGNTNSWLSKIYLCQYVARHLLGIQSDATGLNADRAHEAWLKHPDNAYWSWGDQFYQGIIKGSRYYPRGVTSVLWLEE